MKTNSLLTEYINKLLEKTGGQNGEFWYRGQTDASWPLQSSAIQRITGEEHKMEELIFYHEDLLRGARLIGGGILNRNGRELGDLELLARLQHYGAATCLLDMTSNFNIALWFACQRASEEGEEDGRVFIVPIFPATEHIDFPEVRDDELEEDIDYFLNPNKRRKNKKESESERKKRQEQNPRKTIEIECPKPRFWFWRPRPSMRRMLSQSSKFIFSSYDISKRTELYDYIKIEGKHKKILLSELEQIQGLKPQDIFSDIPGFASVNARGMPHQFKEYKDHLQAGRIGIREEDFMFAIKHLDRANQLKPGDPDVIFALGEAQLRCAQVEGGDFFGRDATWSHLEGAEDDLQKALRLTRRNELQNQIKEKLKIVKKYKENFENAFRESEEKGRDITMITIQKNHDGKWEWKGTEKDGKVLTVGPFDTVKECEADIKNRGLDKEPTVKVGEGEDINSDRA